MNIEGLTNREFQKLTAKKLEFLLKLPVITEWRAMQEQSSLYCPRVDIAVGPFVYNSKCIPDQHDPLMLNWEKQIKAMLDYHKQNVESLPWEVCKTTFDELYSKNKTARCFLAIEIEDKVNRKHLVGAVVNAIALGRLGIVIACSPDKLKAFTKIRKYLWFLSNATNLFTTNLLILSREQFVNSFDL